MIKAVVEVWEQVEAKCYNLVQVDGQGEARNHPKKDQRLVLSIS